MLPLPVAEIISLDSAAGGGGGSLDFEAGGGGGGGGASTLLKRSEPAVTRKFGTNGDTPPDPPEEDAGEEVAREAFRDSYQITHTHVISVAARNPPTSRIPDETRDPISSPSRKHVPVVGIQLPQHPSRP